VTFDLILYKLSLICTLVNTALLTNAKVIRSLSEYVSSSHVPPTPSIASSLSDWFTDKDKDKWNENNVDMEYELLE
jgi:hypothetical protein